MKASEKLKELAAKQAKERAQLEREVELAGNMATLFGHRWDEDKASICQHRDHVSLRLWDDFRTEHKLSECVDVVKAMAENGILVPAQAWRDGCVSIRPEEINDSATKESAVLEGEFLVEVNIQGSDRTGTRQAVKVWFRYAGTLYELTLPFVSLYKLMPRSSGGYNQQGDCLKTFDWSGNTAVSCADWHIKFWSPPGSYNMELHFAEVPTFVGWAFGNNVI